MLEPGVHRQNQDKLLGTPGKSQPLKRSRMDDETQNLLLLTTLG
jgi:hypothetical protein